MLGIVKKIYFFSFLKCSGQSQSLLNFPLIRIERTHVSHGRNKQFRFPQGFCCVEYTPCADETDPFTLGTEDIDVDANLALQEELCTLDFILIEGERWEMLIMVFWGE